MMGRGLLLACALAMGLAPTVQAIPLGLAQQPPDVFAGAMTISYNAGTGVFIATGTALVYTKSPTEVYLVDGVGGPYTLSAIIGNDGTAQSASLIIHGIISALGATDPLLTSSDLLDFGFSPDGAPGQPVFEFLFASIGGSLAPDLASWPLGVFVTSFTPFPGNFQSDFTLANSQSNNFMEAPEPATMTLLAAGLVAMVARRGRRRDLAKRP